jgi:hypothetical protein
MPLPHRINIESCAALGICSRLLGQSRSATWKQMVFFRHNFPPRTPVAIRLAAMQQMNLRHLPINFIETRFIERTYLLVSLHHQYLYKGCV